MDAADWKIIGFVTAPVIGLYGLLIRHISGGNRHPKADDVVYRDVCEERGKANEAEHHHLKEGIDELKVDVRTGFDKMEALIKSHH